MSDLKIKLDPQIGYLRLYKCIPYIYETPTKDRLTTGGHIVKYAVNSGVGHEPIYLN